MTETIYGLAGFCLLIAAYQLGKRRALRKVKFENRTPHRVDAHVIPDESLIIIKSIEWRDS